MSKRLLESVFRAVIIAVVIGAFFCVTRSAAQTTDTTSIETILANQGVTAPQPAATLPSVAVSQSVLQDLLATLKAPKVGTLMDLKANFYGVGYWTGISFGSKGWGGACGESCQKDGAVPYLDLDIGLVGGSRVDPFLPIMLHPANIAAPLWNRMPFKDRVLLPKLPSALELGPTAKIITDKPIGKWQLWEILGVAASVRF